MVKRSRPSFGAILKAAKARCEGCDARENLTVNHKIPIVLGGTNDASNLQILCKECHLKLHGLDKSKKSFR